MEKNNQFNYKKYFARYLFSCVLFLGIFNSHSLAQTSLSKPNTTPTNATNVAPVILTPEQNKVLNLNLEQQHYYVFEENLYKFLPSFNDRSSYLIQKIPTGHPIVFWMLADLYSKHIVSSKYVFEDQKQIAFTKQMLYTALIMTEQDISMCIDTYAKNGPRLLKQKYSTTLDFERRYVFGNKEAFERAVEFLANLKNRPDVSWGCYLFGDKDFPEWYGKTFPKQDEAFLQKDTVIKMRKLME